MKTFFRIFIVSFLFFLVAYSLGSLYSIRNNIKLNIMDREKLQSNIIRNQEEKVKEEMEYDSIERALKESPRMNFLILGLEDIRTDTIILASFDKEAKILDLISIPRDTYIHRKGYNSGPQRKINIIYNSHGISGLRQAVKHILDIQVDKYMAIEYEGVKELVDLVGGVELEVPFHMKYDDESAKPPLHIDIKPGRQVLDGEEALGFLRWRKNNDNKINYIDGDLGRIRAQHEFLKSLLEKSKDNKVAIARAAFNYIETDLNLFEIMGIAKDGQGLEEANINFYTLPGEAEFRTIDGVLNSYYIYDKEGIENLIEDIYNVKKHP